MAGLLLVPWSAAAELEPALQADLYLVQTEAYIKEKNYAAAEETMSKMTALRKEHDIPATDEFHFIYAQVLDLAGAHTEAVASLTRYLELTGNTGQHYWDALELLHRAMESAEQLTHADRVFRDCAECPELVVVPAGTFMMGAPRSEEGRSDNELPRHRVTIREPFAVGVYEVTFAEWDACVDAGGCGRIPDDEGWGRGRRPVINVSWDDAQGYVRWLSDRTGKEYRLLSESEWEYVARAGTETPFHFGSTLSTSQANYIEDFTYGNGSTGEYRGQTVEVGTFAANKYGLHDVHGNVFEWVEDCWNDSYTGAPSDGSAWERGDCSGRVSRGGAWNFKREQLRSAYRFIRNDTGHRINHLGFRVARTEFLDLYLWRTGWRHIVPATTPPRN